MLNHPKDPAHSNSMILPNDARLDVSHPVIDAWLCAVNAGSIDEVCRLYAPDAILLPTLSNELCGTPEQIRGYFEYFLSRPQLSAALQSCYVRQYSEIKIDSGIYEFRWEESGGPCTACARFTFVIRNEQIVEHHSSFLPQNVPSAQLENPVRSRNP